MPQAVFTLLRELALSSGQNEPAISASTLYRFPKQRGLTERQLLAPPAHKKFEAEFSNQIWQSDMTKIWAGPAVGWAYLVCVIDCCTREIVGWNLSHRCRTEDALAAVEQAAGRQG